MINGHLVGHRMTTKQVMIHLGPHSQISVGSCDSKYNGGEHMSWAQEWDLGWKINAHIEGALLVDP